MKYEVIGWTFDTDECYPRHKTITSSVDDAIIAEIRRGGYLFGGDAHENYCPILNDGTKAEYSWRGWGRIMALAHGVEGEMAYMYGYMDMMIKPEARKYPTHSYPDASLIKPEEMLAKVYTMRLADDMFEKVKAGTKTLEVRLFDEKRKKVDIGDYIEFVKLNDESARVLRRVVDFDIFKSFENAFSCVDIGEKPIAAKLRFDPVKLGSPRDADLNSLVDGMYKFYTEAQERECGVVVFRLEKPRHACRTKLTVSTSDWECGNIFSEMLKRATDDAEIDRVLDECYKCDMIQEALEKIDDGFYRLHDGFCFGENGEYDPDLNVMIRKTLGGLIDKARELREVRERYCAAIKLEAVATIATASESPEQKFEFDADIDEFFKTAGIRIELLQRRI